MTGKQTTTAILITLLLVCVTGCTHTLELTLLHVNDTHSHIEPREISLRFDDVKTKVEVGGLPRLYAAIESAREQNENVIFLHAGDAVQGTLYFTRYHGEPEFKWLNWAECDAMVTGNHEYDRGSEILSEILAITEFPMLAANVDFTDDPLLSGEIAPYTILEIDNRTIVVIGVVSAETTETSNPDPALRFSDPAEAVESTIGELQLQGYDLFFVLSHCGITTDLQIARKVPGVDLVIGGHTHTVLATADPVIPVVDGPYPMMVTGADGHTVYVVQAGSYTDQLGQLDLTIDSDGVITSCSGAAPLLAGDTWRQKDASGSYQVVPVETAEAISTAINASDNIMVVQPDSEIMGKLEPFAQGIESVKQKIVGSNQMDLYHQRIPDLLLGVTDSQYPAGSQLAPIVADAMLWKARQVGLNPDFAIQNAGGVRMGLPAGDISVGKIYEIMPFENTLFILELSGKDLQTCFETLMQRIENPDNDGCFPYTGQLRYTIDPLQPAGNRISHLEYLSSSGEWHAIDPEHTYRIATNAYLASGRDGYTVFGTADSYRYDTGFIDAEIFMEYLSVQTDLMPASNPLLSVVQPPEKSHENR